MKSKLEKLVDKKEAERLKAEETQRKAEARQKAREHAERKKSFDEAVAPLADMVTLERDKNLGDLAVRFSHKGSSYIVSYHSYYRPMSDDSPEIGWTWDWFLTKGDNIYAGYKTYLSLERQGIVEAVIEGFKEIENQINRRYRR